MKIVVFSGAGVSQESGINTFRDIKNGLWYNYNVDDVATSNGWKKNREIVLEFHNMLRDKIKGKLPNSAHTYIAELEKEHDVTVITQNVDALHEEAGSTKVLHLHGELNKCRSTSNHEIFDLDSIGVLNVGDKCPLGSQLRPHTVLFDEMPYNIDESASALSEADILIVVGTSLSITYTIPLMIRSIKESCKIYYVDPDPSPHLEGPGVEVNYIREKATEGISKIKL